MMSTYVGRIVAVVGSVGRPTDPDSSRTAAPTDSAVLTLDDGTELTMPARGADTARHTQLLQALRDSKMPVYMEVDTETGTIRRLLLPRLVHVREVAERPVEDRVAVVLSVSHSADYVSTANPDFDRLVAALRRAGSDGTPVLVTKESDRPEIIDVRPAEPASPPYGAGSVGANAAPTAAATTGLTLVDAQRLFNVVKAKDCPTDTVVPTCIPFRFPDNGCWARSHEMCRIMLTHDVIPAKVWSYGRRHVSTRNHPACEVRWDWHSAPVLNADAAFGGFVIDPSLFDRPVTVADWFLRQTMVPPSVPGDFEFTDHTVYQTARISPFGELLLDPTHESTQADLNYHRLQFGIRCVYENPPGPPYPCP